MVSSVRPASGRRIGVAQVLGLLLAFLLMSGLAGVLAAGLVMPAVGATSTVTSTSVRLFDDLPAELEEVRLSEKSVILASDGTLLAEFYDENRIIVGLDQVSQPMKDAVIAIEDHRFYEHGAIDPHGMLRALVRNATCAGDCGTQGGSTLTQQYVKNALVQAAIQGTDSDAERAAAIEAATTSDGTEGVARKLAEAKMAIALEQVLTKDEILERYLNIAQFGLSVYGVEAAARYYFSIPASELTYLQAATIAGITRGPSIYDPTRNPEKSQERRDRVLTRMHDLDMITDEEYQAGKATPIADTLVLGVPAFTCAAANAISGAGYFCDYVTKIIRTNPVFGETEQERKDLLYRGGLTITTTLNPTLQAAADYEVKQGIPIDDPSGVSSAISVVQPGTGYVVAMAQNRVYNPKPGGPRETAVNYNTDNIYGSASGFPPGSTFKPFTLLQWFKDGHGLAEMVNGTERTRNENEFTACGAKLPSRPWRLGNSEGGRGYMTVLDATRNSVNNGYADIAAGVDLCKIMEGAAEIGVHRAGGLAGDGNFSPIPANVIGSESIAPLTMAASFASFASGGIYCEPIAIISVVDSEGEQLPVPSAGCEQRIDPGIAAAMNYTLSQVWQGTGRQIGALPGRPAAGKTGTTSSNEHTWFVGYTPQLSAAVWVGYSEGMIPVQDMRINGRWYDNVYGSSIAGPTWRRFMVRAMNGAAVMRFADPPQQYIGGMKAQVPSVTGMSIEQATRTLRDAGFNVKTGKVWYSSVPAGGVAGTTPAAGTRVTRGTAVLIHPSVGPEPEPEPPVIIPPGGIGGGGHGGG